MKIRSINVGDAKELSVLHVRALPDTVSSKVGSHYLKSIYRSIAKNKKNNCSFVAIENRKIVGVIAATKNLKLFQAHAKKDLSPKNYLLILLSMITCRVSPLEILRRIQFENKLVKVYEKSYATITILFVNKEQRKKGVGSELIKKVLDFYRNEVDQIYVDTLLKNKGAIRLYETQGFKVHKIIKDSIILMLSKKNG